MLIVLEGCDGAGKTTVAKALALILDAEIIHCTSTTPNNRRFFGDILHASDNRNIIVDRFCYGQYVYQVPELRPLGDVDKLFELELDMLANHDVKVIYVTASDQVISDRLHARLEETTISIHDIKQGFEDLFAISMIKPVTIDTTGGTPWVISK